MIVMIELTLNTKKKSLKNYLNQVKKFKISHIKSSRDATQVHFAY